MCSICWIDNVVASQPLIQQPCNDRFTIWNLVRRECHSVPFTDASCFSLVPAMDLNPHLLHQTPLITSEIYVLYRDTLISRILLEQRVTHEHSDMISQTSTLVPFCSSRHFSRYYAAIYDSRTCFRTSRENHVNDQFFEILGFVNITLAFSCLSFVLVKRERYYTPGTMFCLIFLSLVASYVPPNR